RSSHPKQDWVRQLGEKVNSAQQNALSDRHKDEAVDRSMHRRNHLQGYALPALPKQLFRCGSTLPRYGLAVAKQKEDGSQRHAEEGRAMGRIRAEVGTEFPDRRCVHLSKDLFGPAGMRKMLAPPVGDPLTPVRQSSDKIGNWNARFLERPTVIDDLTKLANGLDSKSRKRYDHHRADKSCEEEREDLFGQGGRGSSAKARAQRQV